jgi:non-ribosomal peptide synthetase component E (peptide arylation enzyme)
MQDHPPVPLCVAAPAVPRELNGSGNVAFSELGRVADQRPLAALRAQAAIRHARLAAIDDGSSALTCADVWDAVRRMARLTGQAAPAGRRVAVLLPNTASDPARSCAN